MIEFDEEEIKELRKSGKRVKSKGNIVLPKADKSAPKLPPKKEKTPTEIAAQSFSETANKLLSGIKEAVQSNDAIAVEAIKALSDIKQEPVIMEAERKPRRFVCNITKRAKIGKDLLVKEFVIDETFK